MWQKCPICNGSGQVNGLSILFQTCSVCNGKKIISELTGLPPQISDKKQEELLDKLIKEKTDKYV